MTETITTILCIGLLSIYALLGVTFLIHSTLHRRHLR